MMAEVRLKFLRSFLILFFVQLIFSLNLSAAEICTPLSKQTRYVVQSGEDFFSILKNFQLEPVIGSGGSLEELQHLNNLPEQTAAEAGTEIIIPFKCEEQLIGWRLINKGSYRLITTEKIDQDTTKKSKVETETLKTDNKTIDILNEEMPGQILEGQEGETPSDISEALRYRMICEGEWTGTECITRYSAIFALGGARYSRFDGVDKTTGGDGVLLSKLNPVVGFGWNNYWTENVRTDLQITLVNNEFQPEARGRPIDQDKKLLTSLSAGARFETGKWGFGLGIRQKEKLFYRFYTENISLFIDGGVTVHAVPILDFNASVSYMLHQEGKFRFDGALEIASLQTASSSGFNVNQGTSTALLFSFQHDRVQEYLFGTLRYLLSQQDTTIEQQKASELGFTFGYAWKLKDW